MIPKVADESSSLRRTRGRVVSTLRQRIVQQRDLFAFDLCVTTPFDQFLDGRRGEPAVDDARFSRLQFAIGAKSIRVEDPFDDFGNANCRGGLFRHGVGKHKCVFEAVCVTVQYRMPWI
jgi:hypothetical protein